MNWTVNAAAEEFGVSRETVSRGLRQLGLEVGQGKKFTTKQIHTALAGDFKFEKTREARARADMLGIEIKEKEGKLFSAEIVHEMITKKFGLVRQAVLMALAEIPPRANPTDPQMAKTALLQWAERFWPDIRKGMQE